jgi:hypothetical protein
MKIPHLITALILSVTLFACGGGGGGGGGTASTSLTTLNSSVSSVSSYSSISAGDVGSLNGGTSVAALDQVLLDHYLRIATRLKQLLPDLLPVAYASNSNVAAQTCINTSTKIAGSRDDVSWAQLQLSSNQTEPCLSSIQDARAYLIATAPNVKDSSGNVCDLIFIKKSDGSLTCYNNPLETGGSRVFNYKLGTDSRPSFGPQIGMGTNGASAYLSQNGNYFYAPYKGSNGTLSFVGITSFDLTGASGPVGKKIVHLLSGATDSYDVNWFQGMENGDAYVAYSKNYDIGGADLTQSYVTAVTGGEAQIALGSYTPTNNIPAYTSDLLKEYAAQLNRITWQLFDNYQIIPDPQATSNNHSFFAIQLAARTLLKVSIDSHNAISISDYGDTHLRYIFFTENGAGYGPAAYFNNATGNHSVGDECAGYNISDNYDATDCDFYLVKHDLTGANAADQKILRLFAVGKNAWDYVPVFRTATKVFIPNYNKGNAGDPFLGQTFWNNTITFPTSMYVIDTTNGLDSNSTVSNMTLNPSALDATKTKITSFNINYPRDLLLMKGVMTDSSGTFTSKINSSGISKLTKYGSASLFPDGIQFIAN